MGFLTDKVLLGMFILSLKTRRVVKSAIRGKLNYQARIVAPYVLGALIVGWCTFALSG